MDHLVNIKGGADVTIYGTEGDDGINVTMDHSGSSLTVKTGDGDDSLKAETKYGTLGEGDNFTNTVDADVGKGDDSVSVVNGVG
ncbi:hypothetical protein RCJ22_22535, partial [Vibrio sp. FNV 38]|nr:hypothetical protein [Vibrio sp. FNV 38]MDR9828366.1 hypothetical protein [Vibrio sp. FNV 38]